MTYQSKRVGDLVQFLPGFAFKSDQFNSDGVGLPVVRIRDVKRGWTETYYSGDYAQKFVIHDDDYLIGMDGEFNLGRWHGGKALLNQRVCKIERVSPDLDRDYLARFLSIALKAIEDATPFATVKHLSTKKLASIEIPLPSITVQRRVAEELSYVSELQAKRRQSIALLGDLAKSIFLDMFGNISSKPETVSVGDIATNIRTGPFGSDLLHSEFVDDGIAVLGIDNAVNNEFTWSQRRFITNEKYQKLARYRVYPGDLLITIMGTCGRCAIVPDDIPVAINTKHLCCITLDKNRCLPDFLHAYFLMHPTARRYLERTAKGAIMSGLNATIIKSLPVQLPSLADQERFAKTSSQLREQKSRFGTQAHDFDELFKSLQQRAFRNEL